MRNVVNYEILCANRLEDLEREVVGSFHKGWQPLGGPFVDPGLNHDPELVVFCQAVVMYEDMR